MRPPLRLTLILKLMFVLAVLAGIEFGASYLMAASHHTWEGQGEVTGWTPGSDNRVVMQITCSNGQEGKIYDNKVIVSYLNNPGPLNCWFNENGNLGCDVRPDPKESDEAP